MRTVPVVLVAFLVAAGVPAAVVWKATLGTATLSPLKVLAVFVGMSYFCISLDQTGLLRKAALYAASATRGPKSVFLTVAVLTGLMTLFISNDVLILTLTPIIVHLSAEKGYDPSPFLFLEFITTNVWAISLYIGNTTNIIVADAAGLDFAKYAAILGPAGVAAGLAAVAAIYGVFCAQLSGQCGDRNINTRSTSGLPDIEAPDAQEEVPLRIKHGAICLARLVAMLIFAALESFHRVHLWESVAVGSLASLGLDIAADALNFEGARGSTKTVLANLPWEVLPFVCSLFVMVEVLDEDGSVALMAKVFASLAGDSEAQAVYMVGAVAMVGCQFLTNQPMTVLLTKVLMHPNFNVDARVRSSAMYALIIGSNLGANVVPTAALAGPMWFACLRRSGLHMTTWQFVKVMLHVTPFVTGVALTTVWLQVVLQYLPEDMSSR